MFEGVDAVATKLPHDVRIIRDLAEAAARRTLANYWPTGDAPIDPVAVARNMGVEVIQAELGEDIFGMLVGTASESRIYLDRGQPANRFRFSCAHELGHYVERSERTVDPAEREVAFVDRRSDRDRGEPEEVYANQFAGALLMPASLLRAYQHLTTDVLDLAYYFGVSPAAMRYRLQVLPT